MLNNHSYVKGKLLLLRSKAEPPEDKWELEEKRVLLMTVWIEGEKESKETGGMKGCVGPL